MLDHRRILRRKLAACDDGRELIVGEIDRSPLGRAHQSAFFCCVGFPYARSMIFSAQYARTANDAFLFFIMSTIVCIASGVAVFARSARFVGFLRPPGLPETPLRHAVQIDTLVSTDADGVAGLEQRIGAAAFAVNEARQALRSAADGNQIYRLAASWYGVSTSDVTQEQFATARWFFATFTAVSVALAGSIAALVYYSRSRVPGTQSPFSMLVAKVSRARRAYYARKRRPLKVAVPGPERVIYREGQEPPIVVEKEVPRFIDRIVLIPRFGIRAPTYINSLIRSGEQRLGVRSKIDDAPEVTSNVMTLSRIGG